MLEELLSLLGEDANQVKAKEALRFATNSVLLYIKEDYIPEKLESIVLEIAMARYERFGSEGTTEETVDSVRLDYTSDYLEPHYTILDSYTESKKKKVQFF